MERFSELRKQRPAEGTNETYYPKKLPDFGAGMRKRPEENRLAPSRLRGTPIATHHSPKQLSFTSEQAGLCGGKFNTPLL
jgi:hypothetical protein